ncbi:MAG: ATP-binding protein [Acidobacteria bacterium]|nr:ATP-binding protein [Acidobacteriota bacterium]
MKLRAQVNSFRAKLTLQWLLVFGILLAVTLVGVYFGLRRSLYQSLEDSLHTLAGTEVASSMDQPTVHLHPIESSAIINSRHIEKYVQILTPEYTVINQSKQLSSLKPLVSREAVNSALAGRAVLTEVDLNGVKGLGLSVDAYGQYVFVVAVPLTHIEDTLAALRSTLLIVGLIMLATTALVGYRLATIALRPVDLMTQRAQLIGRDHLKARLAEPETDDELSRLARVLNEMLDRLYQIIESHQRFAADASHELRSPLTSLHGRLELALRRTRTPEEYRTIIVNCLGEVERLTRLAEDLLELARSDAQPLDLDLTETELKPLVEQEVSRLHPMAESRHVTLTSQIDPALTVIADEMRLRRVLGNLLSNAIQYSKPEGGQVTVTAGNGGNEVWIEISDDGVGIEAEQQQYIFERFWRADKARCIQNGSTGLGLAICREIVHAHGGQIKVSSLPRRGSTFRVCFPLRIDE